MKPAHFLYQQFVVKVLITLKINYTKMVGLSLSILFKAGFEEAIKKPLDTLNRFLRQKQAPPSLPL